MVTNSELKSKAKVSFRANYWLSVLAGIILAFFTAAGGSSGRNASQTASSDDVASSGLAGVIVLAVLVAVMAGLILIAIIKIIIGNSLIVGAEKLLVENGRQSAPTAGTFIFVFKEGYWKNVAIVMFLRDLFITLWTLLLIIPGIVKSYEYAMIPFLLADDADMPYSEAFSRSKELMTGNKMRLFILDLSFIGWFLLNLLTLGILGVFYVSPYFQQTRAEFYLALLQENR